MARAISGLWCRGETRFAMKSWISANCHMNSEAIGIFSLIYSIKIQWWDVQHFLKHIFNYLWAATNVMLRSRANLTSIITESLSSSGSLPIEPKAPRSKMFHRCIQVISELLPAWVTICHKPFLTQKHLFPGTKNVAYERQQTCTSCMYAKICWRLPI